ncbi:MAG: PAS domain-containing protein [Nevskia sp.]|nr:PAS domain-containing protein [Nevskia sp.]
MNDRDGGPDPGLESALGAVEEWSSFIGQDAATEMLSGLTALGQSQELLEQLTTAILPGAALASADAAADQRWRDGELQRLQHLVEHLPCVVFVAAIEGGSGNRVYINRTIERLLGYTAEEWLRDPFLWYWRLHPDDRESWNREFARGLASGGPWQADCRFLAADGKPVWVRGAASIVRSTDGQPLFLQGTAFAITDVKEAALQNQVTQERFRAALAALPQGIMICGRDGLVSYVNPPAAGLLGESGAKTGQRVEAALGTIDADGAAKVGERMRSLRPGPGAAGHAPLPSIPLDQGAGRGMLTVDVRTIDAETGGFLLILRHTPPG